MSKGMTVQEAGRKGGITTAQRYGSEFYKAIGKKGGTNTSKKHGRKFYKAIGHKGGQAVKRLIEQGRKAEK